MPFSHTVNGESARGFFSVVSGSALWCDLELAIFLRSPRGGTPLPRPKREPVGSTEGPSKEGPFQP